MIPSNIIYGDITYIHNIILEEINYIIFVVSVISDFVLFRYLTLYL